MDARKNEKYGSMKEGNKVWKQERRKSMELERRKSMEARKKEKYGSRNKQVKIAHSQICQLNREALAGA